MPKPNQGDISTLRESKSPSIFLLSSTNPKLGRRGNRSRRDVQTSLSLVTLSSSFWRILRCSQARKDQLSLQRVLSLPGGLLPIGQAWKISKGRWPRGILIRCPNSFSWLLSMQKSSGSAPSLLWTVELLTLSQRLSPATLWKKKTKHFSHLYLWLHSFGHYPDLSRPWQTMGEQHGCNKDGPVSW